MSATFVSIPDVPSTLSTEPQATPTCWSDANPGRPVTDYVAHQAEEQAVRATRIRAMVQQMTDAQLAGLAVCTNTPEAYSCMGGTAADILRSALLSSVAGLLGNLHHQNLLRRGSDVDALVTALVELANDFRDSSIDAL